MLIQDELHEQLIGVIVSENLYRDEMGYGLVITRNSIMGARKPGSIEDFAAYLGPGSNVADATRAQAEQIAERLVGTRDFLISAGSIGQVIFRKPGMFFGGYLIIKTGLSSLKISMRLLSIGGSDLLEISNMLEQSIWMVVGERFYKLGKDHKSNPRGQGQ